MTSERAEISGAFARPTLVEYLTVAEHEQLSLSLRIYVGALEVGFIGVSGGRVVHAELPGAAGDLALSMIARFPKVRVMADAFSSSVANVHRPWRELVERSVLDGSPGRADRLTQVRAELRELQEEAGQSASPRLHVEGPLDGIVADLLDWAAVEAYLGDDFEAAQLALSRREELASGDIACIANLERLRLRLLEDEITTQLVETGR